MKKLKLDLQSIKGIEILTRSQLKSIGGGNSHACGPLWCEDDQICVEEPGGSTGIYSYKCKTVPYPWPICLTEGYECAPGTYCANDGSCKPY